MRMTIDKDTTQLNKDTAREVSDSCWEIAHWAYLAAQHACAGSAPADILGDMQIAEEYLTRAISLCKEAATD